MLALVAGGMLGVLSACKPADVSWKYVRLIAVLCLASLAGATAWLLRELGWHWRAAPTPALLLAALVPTAVLIGLAPVAARRRRWFVFVAATGAIAAVAAAVLRAAALNPSVGGSAAGWLWMAIGLVASAFLLGSVTNAWDKIVDGRPFAHRVVISRPSRGESLIIKYSNPLINKGVPAGGFNLAVRKTKKASVKK